MASPKQRRKVKRVMHEFKEGDLKGGRGQRGKVKSRRQAIAIAMSESGQSRQRGKRKTTKAAAKRGTAAAKRGTTARKRTTKTTGSSRGGKRTTRAKRRGA
jgi:Family of unknown function (DUF6496)